MTITFDNDNDIVVYTPEKIICYARMHRYLFVGQCVWLLALSVLLEKGLVVHINNLQIRSELYLAPADSATDTARVHSGRVSQIELSGLNQEDYISCDIRESSKAESEYSNTSQDQKHDQVFHNCEEFLRQSKIDRKIIVEQSLKNSQQLPWKLRSGVLKRRKLRKTYRQQTLGIEEPELRRRKNAGECHRCAWPQDTKGAHMTLGCRRSIRKSKGIVPVPTYLQ